jgi:hypothetical protein
LVKTKSKQLNDYLIGETRHFYKETEFFCRQYFTKDQKEDYLNDLKSRRLFVNKIPKDMDDNELLQLFRTKYVTEKAYQIRKNKTESMGYGYVIFVKEKEAKRVLDLARHSNGYLSLSMSNHSKVRLFIDQYRDREFR